MSKMKCSHVTLKRLILFPKQSRAIILRKYCKGNEIEILRSTHHGVVVVLREVFFVVVDCCFLELLTQSLTHSRGNEEPTENQEILNLDFTSETAGIFRTRKQDGDYPGKAYTVGRKFSLGWNYVEWNEKNSSFRGGKWDRREHT